MRRVCFPVLLIFFVGTTAGLAQDPAGDSNPNTAAASDSGAAVTGHAFSAVKYSRRVRNRADGKQTVLSEENVMRVARDADGRVRVELVEGSVDCDGLGRMALEKCDDHDIVLFNPTLRRITHWLEGEIAAHGAVVIQLNAGQIESAENSTLAIPEQESKVDSDGAIITVAKLPGKSMDGVVATGVRTTSVIPAGHWGNKYPITTIHEVWTSQEMQLVIRVIDGDPSGEETISGLEHVSLNPDSALFHWPDGYRVEDRNQWSDESQYADGDMAKLARWFVR